MKSQILWLRRIAPTCLWAVLGYCAVNFPYFGVVTDRFGNWPFGVALGDALWLITAAGVGVTMGLMFPGALAHGAFALVAIDLPHYAFRCAATNEPAWFLGVLMRVVWLIVAMVFAASVRFAANRLKRHSRAV